MSHLNNHLIAVVAVLAIGLGASLPAFSQDSQTPAPQNAPPMSGMPGGMMGHGGQGGMMGSGNQNGGQQGGMGNMMVMMPMMMGMMTMMTQMNAMMSQMNAMMMTQMQAQGAGMMQGGMQHHHDHHDASPKSGEAPEKD